MRRRARGGAGGVRLGASSTKVQLARELRRRATAAEAALWQYLRRKALGGWRFRRQHVVAGFIADFYCPALELAIEVDGAAHDGRSDEDEVRQEALERLGVAVLRFTNDEVLGDPDAVCSRILSLSRKLACRIPPPKPGAGQGGG